MRFQQYIVHKVYPKNCDRLHKFVRKDRTSHTFVPATMYVHLISFILSDSSTHNIKEEVSVIILVLN